MTLESAASLASEDRVASDADQADAAAWNTAWDEIGTDTGLDMGTTHLAPGVTGTTVAGPANAVALSGLAAALGEYAFAAGFGDGSVIQYAGEVGAGGPRIPRERVVISHEAAVTAVATVGGTVLSAGQDGTVRSGAGVVIAPGGWCEHLTVAPAGNFFAVACGRSVVLGTAAGETGRLEDHPSSVSGLATSPDGRQLAASHYNGVTIWSLKSGAKVRTLSWKGSHIGVTWSPDGRFVVSATQERELHVWDLATDKDFRLGGYATKVRAIAWLHDPAHLVASGADAITAWPFGDVGPGVLPPKEIGFGHNATVSRVAVHPAKPQLAGAYSNGTVLVGGVKKGEAAFVRNPDGVPVTALAYTAGGLLVAATRSGAIDVISFDQAVP